jgi:hypothetical protein
VPAHIRDVGEVGGVLAESLRIFPASGTSLPTGAADVDLFQSAESSVQLRESPSGCVGERGWLAPEANRTGPFCSLLLGGSRLPALKMSGLPVSPQFITTFSNWDCFARMRRTPGPPLRRGSFVAWPPCRRGQNDCLGDAICHRVVAPGKPQTDGNPGGRPLSGAGTLSRYPTRWRELHSALIASYLSWS